MKTRILSSLVTLALGLAASLPLSASSTSAQPAAYQVSAVKGIADQVIQPGDTQMKVVRWLNAPDRKLSRETWIYRDFRPQSPAVAAEDCSTLVITFQAGKVSDLKLVNEGTVVAMLRDLPNPDHAPVRIARK